MRWRGSRRLRFAGAIMGEETEDGGWGSTLVASKGFASVLTSRLLPQRSLLLLIEFETIASSCSSVTVSFIPGID